MILKNHTTYDKMCEYDPVTGALTTFFLRVEPQRMPSEISGFFDHLGGKLVVLFRLAGILYLQVESQRIPIDNHTVEVQTVHGHRVLRVLTNGKAELEIRYEPPIIDPPLSEDPTPFVEEEHFDFGLFLANLSRDRGRQARIFGGS
jgi:hypothetical protein